MTEELVLLLGPMFSLGSWTAMLLISGPQHHGVEPVSHPLVLKEPAAHGS